MEQQPRRAAWPGRADESLCGQEINCGFQLFMTGLMDRSGWPILTETLPEQYFLVQGVLG